MKFDLKSSPRHIQRLTNIASVISGINGIYVIIDNKVSTPYFNTKTMSVFYLTVIIAMRDLSS